MDLETFLLADIAMLVGASAVLFAFLPDMRDAERDGRILAPWGYLVMVAALSLIAIGTITPCFLVIMEVIRFTLALFAGAP